MISKCSTQKYNFIYTWCSGKTELQLKSRQYIRDPELSASWFWLNYTPLVEKLLHVVHIKNAITLKIWVYEFSEIWSQIVAGKLQNVNIYLKSIGKSGGRD